MRGSDLREALTTGRRVYGICLEGFAQPRWPKLFGRLGLDFVFIDSEHTPHGRETIAHACQAYASCGVAPLLRIPEPRAILAAMGLDAGAHGIIAPYVETVDQVKDIVGAVKYRPLKGAGLASALNEGIFPGQGTQQYLAQFNADSVVAIMIESPAGVENLDRMLAVPGVDGVLIGPHDLSVSCGVPEQYDHPTFEKAVRQVIKICHQHQVGVGIHAIRADPQLAICYAGWGSNLIMYASDSLFIMQGIEQGLGQIRQALEHRDPS